MVTTNNEDRLIDAAAMMYMAKFTNVLFGSRLCEKSKYYPILGI
jgi:hypothetical protein